MWSEWKEEFWLNKYNSHSLSLLFPTPLLLYILCYSLLADLMEQV